MSLRLIDATTDEHFRAMSLIHALGWRTTYQNAVPADYMAEVITDDRWVDYFRVNYKSDAARGLLLMDDGRSVACCNYGAARADGYEGWGELISFYTHPDEKNHGYGSVLMTEALLRLRDEGYEKCYLLVLRENENARRFYEKHGFRWDGTHEDIPFPHDTVCVDLRYTRTL